MRVKIANYILTWMDRGYQGGIPDEVPEPLAKLNLAPSYKSIALAILNNDHNLISLGFSPKKSEWYSAFKKIEIDAREGKDSTDNDQLRF